MELTPRIMRASYDYLKACPPFDGWGLIPGHKIKFIPYRSRLWAGFHRHQGGERHEIGLAENFLSHHENILRVMSHEMVHLYQVIAGRETRRVIHNADFVALGREICAIHGFDPKLFV